MRLAGLLDRDKRTAYFSTRRKLILARFKANASSRPVFVFGKQRSGTSMLMYAFHRYPGAFVYDEHRNSPAFVDFRIRDFHTVRALVEESRFPLVCFKPICDSHLIQAFVDAFRDAHHIWIYRSYRDVANSSLRKFENPTRAIRLVCTEQPGGGWFQEGISKSTADELRKIYGPHLSEFDMGCLVWWARNRIILESGLIGRSNLTIVKYEALVTDPSRMLRWLFERIGAPYHSRVASNIVPDSIARNPAPDMDPTVREFCDGMAGMLDKAFLDCSPPAHPEITGEIMPGAAVRQ